MYLTRGHFSGRNDFTLLINAAVYLILKRGFSAPAARYRGIRIGGGYILFISRSGFGYASSLPEHCCSCSNRDSRI